MTVIRSGAQVSASTELDSSTGLSAIGRDLQSQIDPGLSSLMQLPHYYWNNLNEPIAQPDMFSPELDFMSGFALDDTVALPFDSLINEPAPEPQNQDVVFSALMKYMIDAARTE